MSFFDAIINLQKAPQRKRVTVLAISVTVCMILIIGVWIAQLSYQLGKRDDQQKESASFSQPFRDIFNPVYAKIKSLL